MNWKIGFLLLLIIFSISIISAECSDGQIDINSASLEDMMKIKGLGGEGIIAQRVIDARPFDSVDDLINVKGIGEVTLEKINSQDLACVVNEEENEEEKEVKSMLEVPEEEEEIEENYKITDLNNNNNEKKMTNVIIENKIINLSPKDIKMNEDSSNQDKNQNAIYGLIVFCILLMFLFFIQNRRKNGIR